MFRLPSIRIGRLFGIPVELNASWFLVLVLVSAGLAFGYFPVDFPGRPLWVDVLSGTVAALLFFGSIVLHEVSHSVVARRVGLNVDKVTLFLFGGVAQLSEEPRTPGSEFVMAVAGPSASVLVAFASFCAYVLLVTFGVSDRWWAPLPYLAQVNLLVAGFNLLPGFPMDGGRVVRSLLWWASGDKRIATRVAGIGGQLVGWMLILAGLYGVYLRLFGLLWLALLGLFIRTLAARSSTQSDRVVQRSVTPLEDVMRAPVPVVSRQGGLVTGAVASAPEAARVWAVVEDGRVVGALDTWGQPAAVESGEVERVVGSSPIPPLVDAQDSADVAARILSEGAAVVWVVRRDRLVGYVTPSAVGLST